MKLHAPDLTPAAIATVQRLASTCSMLRTSQVMRRCEDDTVLRQMRLDGSRGRDLAAYIGGLVVAEVAIARRNREAA